MHVAIMMDGNERWATQRGLTRAAGHVEGAKTVHAVVEAAAQQGVETLTLYAFAAANWARSSAEVDALTYLFRGYLATATRRCVEQLIRISVIGRRDWLGEDLRRAIEQSERLSRSGTRMHLRFVIDYSAHDSIVQAAWRGNCSAKLTAADFHCLVREVDRSALPAGAVDLLIRTGGERRLSDFMLWEVAYAELRCANCLWPDFGELQFESALVDYASRRRCFGVRTAGAR